MSPEQKKKKAQIRGEVEAESPLPGHTCNEFYVKSPLLILGAMDSMDAEQSAQ